MTDKIKGILEELRKSQFDDVAGKNGGILKGTYEHGRLLAEISEESSVSAEKNLQTSKNSLRVAYFAAWISLVSFLISLIPVLSKKQAGEIKHFHEHTYGPNPYEPAPPNWPNIGTLTPNDYAKPNDNLKNNTNDQEIKCPPTDFPIQPTTLPIKETP